MIEKVKRHIDDAFKFISAISVHGDTVDVMAQVRHELRMAYSELSKLEDTEDSGEVSADG